MIRRNLFWQRREELEQHADGARVAAVPLNHGRHYAIAPLWISAVGQLQRQRCKCYAELRLDHAWSREVGCECRQQR